MNATTVALLKRVSTATLTTQLFKRGLRNVFMQGVRPLGGLAENLVGPAYTLRNIPAREDIDRVEGFANPEHPQRKAVENAPAGHVMVIDCRGDPRVASAGEILATRLMVRGAAGLVSDGGLRDSASIAAMAMPVFCSGPSAPLNLVQHHAVDINVPIACGGVAVYPGDMIVGDADGVVVVPAHLADEIAVEGAAQEEMEAFLLTRIQQGATLPGTYPPNEATRAAYAAWKAGRS
ncbi:MAG: ribonuclease activity regulator RraA [Rhodospirillales bacterium]|nr:ribonuclease activity regulator RraA [Rhodospirillales bacterium]MDE2199923.1 ribonuclease activity regulator RraA [Rhodospirillales bacterium]